MESHSENSQPTPTQAQKALDGLSSDNARLAAKVCTPPWYHPIYGAIVAVLVLSQSFAGSVFSLFLTLACTLGLAFLVRIYTDRYGVAISSPVGKRSRRVFVAVATILIVAMAAAFLLGRTEISLWWVVLIAIFTGGNATVLGRAYDARIRSELGSKAAGQI